MINTLKALYQCRLLTFKGLWYLLCAIRVVGINLMALLYVSQRFYPKKIALQDENSNIDFATLYKQSQHLADQLAALYHIKPKQKIAVMAYNHVFLAHTLFALSTSGSDIYLLNAEMSFIQFEQLNKIYKFDLIIHDPDIKFLEQKSTLFTYHDSLPSIQLLLDTPLQADKNKRSVVHFSKIIVLTSGSTGSFKVAGRSAKAKSFIKPFTALLTKLNLNQYASIYIATPIYHGFGIATFCISILLGATGFLQKRFKANEASQLLNDNKIEVITLVPLMLNRLLKHDSLSLSSLKCIITGGSPITEALVKETQAKLGKVLFNLYGTSEAGVCTIATPDDLALYPNTIGLPIKGLSIKLMQNNKAVIDTVGELYIKCAWSIEGNEWISTGDLGYKDQQGYYYLQGRIDDMIVSAGENVYPHDLEQKILEHPFVTEACVLAINDDEFGQRLVAFIVLDKAQYLSESALLNWLCTKIARYQIPKRIIQLNEIPITAIGKPNKKLLFEKL